MTAELVDTNAQISDITEMIQKKNSRKRYEFEELSKTPGNRSRLKNKSGKVHPINGRHVTSSTFSGWFREGLLGAVRKDDVDPQHKGHAGASPSSPCSMYVFSCSSG